MSALERVLSAIDSGLQSSGETGYADDRLDRCARCQWAEAVEGGDLCAGCRAHLLGDGPEPVADEGINGVVTAIDREGLALLLNGPGGMTAVEFLAQYPRDPPPLGPLDVRVGDPLTRDEFLHRLGPVAYLPVVHEWRVTDVVMPGYSFAFLDREPGCR